jgi:hypothetical protein
VDEDIRNIFALPHASKSNNITVNRAKNDQEALEMLDRHPDADVMLMDIMMPIMNGYDIYYVRSENKRGIEPLSGKPLSGSFSLFGKKRKSKVFGCGGRVRKHVCG